jgi:maltose alpha-D-glucosyltransferase/alpha-amylase
MARARTPGGVVNRLKRDPLWYKDAVIYELHVRAFRDSGGDGIGDFRGLVEKLDYLVDLGITAVWLLPFYPSPRRDDGYDIADYCAVNPDYGTMRDMRRFVTEAHRRGLQVITELVCNHTSDQHPWFQKARHARRGSRAREMYVWSDTDDRYRDARVIFRDFEDSNWTWDHVAGAYFWHRFYSHQPDLNFDSPDVHRALMRAVDFWLEAGVDGLRLDAVPYLYEREGTNGENLPETHAFLRQLRRHVDERFEGRMLLAEANQWPERAVAYFGRGRGDECHMAFHFPIMPRLYMALRREDRFPIVDILQQTPAIPETAQWALFLRNHDELTLEMVTDEERDFMYRSYATDPQARVNLGIRRRLAPLVGNHRGRIELLNALLFSLPGTPVVYYGDEIGMGDNIYLGDRDAVRTPMQWSDDRNAGFSTADASRLYLPVVADGPYSFRTVNVEAQRDDPHSLLAWMRRLIALRRRHRVFGRGSLEMLEPENRRVLAFIREHDGERILVVANLSRFAQPVELDLARFSGARPVELFGRTEFPPIDGRSPYMLTLGPHGFLWLALETDALDATLGSTPVSAEPPPVSPFARWTEVPGSPVARELAGVLTEALAGSRFEPLLGDGLRAGARLEIIDAVPIGGDHSAIVLVRIPLSDGDTVAPVPLAIGQAVDASRIDPASVVARFVDDSAVIYDPSGEPWFGGALLGGLGRRAAQGRLGSLSAHPRRELARIVGPDPDVPSALVRKARRNLAVRVGPALAKLYTRAEPGPHPELELGRAFAEQGLGAAIGATVELTYGSGSGPSLVVGSVAHFVSNEGDAWDRAVESVATWLEASRVPGASPLPVGRAMRDALERPRSRAAVALDASTADWAETARRMGVQTARMHRALAATKDEPAFSSEPLGELAQRALYQSIRARLHEADQALRRSEAPQARAHLDALGGLSAPIDRLLRRLLDHPYRSWRIRTHGDLRLEQFLHTGSDVVIVDPEGDPARPLTERRIRRAAQSDLALVFVSFVEAAAVGHRLARERLSIPEEAPLRTELLRWIAASFAATYSAYLGELGPDPTPLLPERPADHGALMTALAVGAIATRLAALADEEPDRAELLIPALEALAG